LLLIFATEAKGAVKKVPTVKQVFKNELRFIKIVLV